MNAAHVHLLLNHFPVLGLVFGICLLLVAWLRPNPELVAAALVVLLITALISIPVYLTGEPAEELVERLPGISEDVIEAHEEAALVALIGLELVGIVSALGLYLRRGVGESPAWLAPTVLAVAVIVAGWVAWTSHLGGRISHPETRPDFVVPAEAGHEEGD